MNKVLLRGYLASNPEVKILPNGDIVAYLQLITQSREHQDLHKLVAYYDLAIIAKQFREGDQVFFEGSLRVRSWVDSNNNHKKTTEIVAKELYLVYQQQTNTNINTKSDSNIDISLDIPKYI